LTQTTFLCNRLINGIVELNRKSALIPFPRRRQPSEVRWLVIFGTTAMYAVVYHVLSTNAWSLQTLNVHTATKYLFGPPFFVDLVIVVSACFYLSHINCAFQTLVDICDEYLLRLPKQRFGPVDPECRRRLAEGANRRAMRKTNFSPPETETDRRNSEFLNDRNNAELLINFQNVFAHFLRSVGHRKIGGKVGC